MRQTHICSRSAPLGRALQFASRPNRSGDRPHRPDSAHSLTRCPQGVRMVSLTSSALTLNQSPSGQRTQSPPVFPCQRLTMWSRPVQTSDLKFPDHTTILGLVSKNHGAACRGEFSALATRGQEKQPIIQHMQFKRDNRQLKVGFRTIGRSWQWDSAV